MREPRHAQSIPIGPAGPTRSTKPPSITELLLSPLKLFVSVIRGVIEGALPMVILVGIVALFWEITTITRYVTAPYGFPATQQSETIIGESGLVISLIVFLISGMRTLHGVRDRHSEGEYVESSVALAVLAISLLILAITVWTTISMPQHPAP